MASAALSYSPEQITRSTRSTWYESHWIISPRYDLCFFIGSCVLTLLFLGIYKIAHNFGYFLRGDSILITYFLFTALLDHPHIFQTFSRTHYDKEEFQKRPRLYTWGLAAFIGFGFIILGLGWETYLIVGAALYGTWHIIKQHYGFVKIYKARNRDHQPLDNYLDAATFFTGMFSCFLYDYGDIHGPLVIYGDLQVNFPSVPGVWGETGRLIFFVLAGAMLLRAIQKARNGQPVNLPKLLLMSAALGTHYYVFFLTATPFLVAEALETAYHNVQYQGFVMQYQKRRFPEIKRMVAAWFGLAMLYGLVVGTIEVLGLMNRGWAMWLFVPATMVVVFHYFVDGLIWRFRDDPKLRQMFSAPSPRE